MEEVSGSIPLQSTNKTIPIARVVLFYGVWNVVCMAWVYILRCDTGRYYIGSTDDIERRMQGSLVNLSKMISCCCL